MKRLVLLGCLILCTFESASAEDRPNLLFIAIDDLNDWVGSMGGHPQTQTPNLDRLAGEGMLFTNAYTAAPACNPSRCALLTGIRPSRSGVTWPAHRSDPYLKLPRHPGISLPSPPMGAEITPSGRKSGVTSEYAVVILEWIAP